MPFIVANGEVGKHTKTFCTTGQSIAKDYEGGWVTH